MRSWKKPTPEQVSKAVALLNRPGQYRYFFERLQNPLWLEPLREKRIFSNPPSVEIDDTTGLITIPFWPASKYLSRMASEDPSTVQRIALEIPETDNGDVHKDIVEAALAMPSDSAVSFVDNCNRWMKSPYRSPLLPEHVADLASHLAKSGEIEAAIKLFNSVLRLNPRDKSARASTLSPELEREPAIELADYLRIVRSFVPDLVDSAGIRSLRECLIPLLIGSVRRDTDPSLRASKIWNDGSNVWRDSIELDPQDGFGDIRDALVMAVREASLNLYLQDHTLLPDIVSLLESKHWLVFHRISLNLLSRARPEEAVDLARPRLLDREYFEVIGLRAEYSTLAERFFAHLGLEEQSLILNWISDGPNVDRFTENMKAFSVERTDEQIDHFVLSWQRDRLAPIREHLPSTWAARFESMVQTVGEPRPLASQPVRAEFHLSESPLSAEKIDEMGVLELRQFLADWKPETTWDGPTVEGLERELRSAVVKDAGRFSQEAQQFRGLRPGYITSLFYGLDEALRAGAQLHWSSVLELGSWAVSQSRPVTSYPRTFEDPANTWAAPRSALVRLIEGGLAPGKGAILLELRTTVWNVIVSLTRDPEPSIDYEQEFGGDNMNPAELSINTIRSSALHAVIQYALWLRRHVEEDGDPDGLLISGFDYMPEVRATLIRHLNPGIEPSAAVRAVYGWWFPWLDLLDHNWAVENRHEIFPLDGPSAELGCAAWGTYLVRCQCFDSAFDVLADVYDQSMTLLCTSWTIPFKRANPTDRLVEHLAVQYWRGRLSGGMTNSLIAKFYSCAPVAPRSHLFRYSGRSLHRTESPVADAVLERLRDLWDQRISWVSGQPSDKTESEEFVAFGWWFASGKFDDQWSAEQLERTLALCQHIEPDHLVVRRLAEFTVFVNPGLALKCLHNIVESDKDGWGLFRWKDAARSILRESLASSDPEVRSAGVALADMLGVRGFLEFRDLLRTE